MKKEVANKKNLHQTEAVEKVQQDKVDVAKALGVESGLGASAKLVVQLVEYINKNDIPILSEFCANNNYSTEIIIERCLSNELVRQMLKLLETKKRGALERMIYTGELNATIGTHLIRSWEPIVIPGKEPPEPEVQDWILMLTPEESKQYQALQHKLHGLTSFSEEYIERMSLKHDG